MILIKFFRRVKITDKIRSWDIPIATHLSSLLRFDPLMMTGS